MWRCQKRSSKKRTSKALSCQNSLWLLLDFSLEVEWSKSRSLWSKLTARAAQEREQGMDGAIPAAPGAGAAAGGAAGWAGSARCRRGAGRAGAACAGRCIPGAAPCRGSRAPAWARSCPAPSAPAPRTAARTPEPSAPAACWTPGSGTSRGRQLGSAEIHQQQEQLVGHGFPKDYTGLIQTACKNNLLGWECFETENYISFL